MDSKLPGGPASGVRVFTVFVLSGSLFLLIYNVGRRRMNKKNSQSVRDANVSGNPSFSRGYFNHHRNKPLARHRNPSLTAALETSSISTDVKGPSNPSDHGKRDSSSSDTPTDSRDGNLSGVSVDYFTRGGHTETEASTYAGTGTRESTLERSSFSEHEVHMIEHMRRNFLLKCLQGSTSSSSFDREHRTSSSSILGDMSRLENLRQNESGEQDYSDMPRVAVATALQREDFGSQRSLVLQTGSASPTRLFTKPLVYICIWFVLSSCFKVYNSTGWGSKMTRFPAPFLKSTVYSLIQSLLSSCMLRWPTKRTFFMPWETCLLMVVPVAVAAALEQNSQDPSVLLVTLKVPISSNNEGYIEQAQKMISSLQGASIGTVWDTRNKSKGFVPLFVFLFALAFRLETRSASILVSIGAIAVGFILADTNGPDLGFLTFRESTVIPFASGFRWAATQVLLQRRELGLTTPVVTMRALSPAMAMVTLLLSLVEPWGTLASTEFFDTPDHILKSFGFIIIGALLATAVALAELLVIYHTSALTLMLLEMFKEVFTVMVPRISREDDFPRQSIGGIAFFLVGLASFSWLKYQMLLERTMENVRPVPSGSFMYRWPRTWTFHVPDFPSPFHYARGLVNQIHDGSVRLARKIYALWELVT